MGMGATVGSREWVSARTEAGESDAQGCVVAEIPSGTRTGLLSPGSRRLSALNKSQLAVAGASSPAVASRWEGCRSGNTGLMGA